MNPDTLEAPVEAPVARLTANDRCDSCGAQAYVEALMSSGELLFCSHHWNQYRGKIEPAALEITDETYKLHIKLDASA